MMPLQGIMRLFGNKEAEMISRDPIVVLGRVYTVDDDAVSWPKEFVRDAASRPWFMYRSGFSRIERDPQGPSPLNFGALIRGAAIDPFGFVSDAGWGCMIRTTQCMIGAAIQTLRRGRDYICPEVVPLEQEQELAALFCDAPEAQLSVHNFVARGAAFCGRKPGEWFGPSVSANVTRQLLTDSELQVYISDGMDVYSNKLLEIAEKNGNWSPTIVLCGLRLGIECINPVYYDGIKALLATPQSLGLAGGRTSASLYFYGYQNNKLFFHDPHTVKPALLPNSDAEALKSIRSSQIYSLLLEEMDPSILAGFLLLSRQDFEDWSTRLESVTSESRVICIQQAEPEISEAFYSSGCESADLLAAPAPHTQAPVHSAPQHVPTDVDLSSNNFARPESIEVLSPKAAPEVEGYIVCSRESETRTEYL